MMSDLLEPQEIKPMFEGCGTSFYLPDSYCRERERETHTDRQTDMCGCALSPLQVTLSPDVSRGFNL